MNTASLRTALIAAAIVAIGAFALLSIGGADAQQACIQSLAGNGTVNGTWHNGCLSENTPLGDYNYPSGTRYARFYTFTLSAPSAVTMELKSSTDTYMYLMSGKGKTGTIEYYNDDIVVNENTNSRISESLPAGDYTIEATTYDIETTGSFTLTVSGLPDASTPTVTPTSGAGETPTVTPTPISGQDTPTPTPTSTPTRTPTPTTVPTDVLDRLTALETRVATQQRVISTLESKVTVLDSRVATLEAGASNPAPSSAPCRIARPYGYQPFPETLHGSWGFEGSCVINDYNGQSLYKYDAFIATNSNGIPWQARLRVPISGLQDSLLIREYNPQTDEWVSVGDPAGSPSLYGRSWLKWTPVTGRTYSVTAVGEGLTVSPFTLTYDYASDSNSQGAQPQMTPSDISPSQLQSLQKTIEDMGLEDDDEAGAE